MPRRVVLLRERGRRDGLDLGSCGIYIRVLEKVHESMPTVSREAFCLSLLAEASFLSGAYEEAVECCNEALEICGRTGCNTYESEKFELDERIFGCSLNQHPGRIKESRRA